jgi:hypothetical protein
MRLADKPLLKEFAEWLYRKEYYEEYGIEELLCKEWDGAFPTNLASDDLLIDIGNFLYCMAEFAVEKVYGEDYWSPTSMHHIRIVREPSYEDRSYVYVLELKTRTVLAEGCGAKTWHFDLETIEHDLKDLIRQLEESKKILAVRIMVNG